MAVGAPTDGAAKLKTLERENQEPRQTNEIASIDDHGGAYRPLADRHSAANRPVN